MIDFVSRPIVPPPAAMAEYVASLHATESATDSEKRSRQRYQILREVPAVVLDDGFQPSGELFLVITRDISTNGMSLVHTRAIESGMLALALRGSRGEQIQVAMRVLRCRPLGDYCPVQAKF